MASTKPTSQAIDVSDEELDAMIEQDPYKSGRHNGRFVEYGTHVWAIIADLQGNDWNIAQTAADYDIPEVAVRAAIRYYERHRELIDAELMLQHESYISG